MKPLRILYFLRHHGYLKSYESTLQLLLEQGHQVQVVFERKKPVPLAERLAEAYPDFSYGFTEQWRQDDWRRLAAAIRTGGDYLRYLTPEYEGTEGLRERVERSVAPRFLSLLGLPGVNSRAGRQLLSRTLRVLHRAVPSSPELEALIEAQRPDLVLVNPLVDVKSPQAELVRSAKALGLPTGYCVNSWDNLTNKGLIWETPGRVFVWNEQQKCEATALHGVPPERVTVTGAQTFDEWFGWSASSSRQEFLSRVGLDPEQPYLLYLCSSSFIAPGEPAFVERWIRAVRVSDNPLLRAVGILIRPHAGNSEPWRGFEAGRFSNTVVWPPLGASPIDQQSKADYYDSMYHSAAIVGINTSAMIEAAIVGRPVHTILATEFAHGQHGTIHFRYLLPEQGGFLRVAQDMPEHLEQLRAALAGAVDPEWNREFVKRFIRPRGLEQPAAPILASEIEALGREPRPVPESTPAALLPVQAGLRLALSMQRLRKRKNRSAERNRKKAGKPYATLRESPARKLKILIVTPHEGYIRNSESTLKLLAERGHEVQLAFEREETKKQEVVQAKASILGKLQQEFPNLETRLTPTRPRDLWSIVANEARRGINYFRYLGPEYREAHKLRSRAESRAPESVARIARWQPVRSRVGRAVARRVLRAVEMLAPVNSELVGFLEQARPDIVITIPLVEFDPNQADYIRAAKQLGIRTGLLVHSWDNLTNKGVIHHVPDLVAVWNEAQKREAVDLLGVPPARVAVTGAPGYDQWFSWTPSTSRVQFCERVGLRADRPYILYLCSSPFIAPEEVGFVGKWIGALRSAAELTVREAGVLIRPHPQNAAQWREVDLSDLPEVAIFPRGGANPTDAQSKADYFDSIFHSAAVVGINTSAQIESAILGRAVLTILAPEFRDTQEGTLHFHHLLQVNGGLLQVARDFGEHTAQLAAVLAEPAGAATQARRFVEAFVRPQGLETAATPQMVTAIEETCARPAPAPEPRPRWAEALQPPMTPVMRWSRAAQNRLRRRSRGGDAGDDSPGHEAEPLTPKQAVRLGIRGALRVQPLRRVAANQVLPALDRVSSNGHAAPPPLRPGLGFVRKKLETALTETSLIQRLDYPRDEILLLVRSKAESKRLQSCAKEPWTVEWIEQWVQPGDVLYDIGANIGAYSLVAAKRTRGEARVIAVEPGYGSFSALCQNVVLNGCTESITPLPINLGPRTGLGRFRYRDLRAGAADHGFSTDKRNGSEALYEQPVMSYRLDDLIEQLELPPPTHIKLDVDGVELGVLEGAQTVLASPTLRSILIEVNPRQSEAVIEVLRRHGLELRTKITERQGQPMSVWYGLFTPVAVRV